jgi:hypothetical protein
MADARPLLDRYSLAGLHRYMEPKAIGIPA